MNKSDVSIVVPYYNRWDLTHVCLADLYKHARECEIILVDDESDENEAIGGTAWWLGNHALNIKYHRNDENLGFLKSMNVGAALATGKIVVLLSNDVKIYGDFVSPLIKLISEDPNTLIGGRVLNYDTGWNAFKVGSRSVLVPYCEGWFLALSKAGWDELGGFDERYAPNDFEDVDLSFNALYNGYRLAALDESLLRHDHLGTTVNAVQGVQQRAELTKKNREKFIMKWEVELEKFAQMKLGYQYTEG